MGRIHTLQNGTKIDLTDSKYGKTVVNSKTGESFTALYPNGKEAKAVIENYKGYRITNSGEDKKDENGKLIPLTYCQRSFRAGVITAGKDSRAAYRARQAKK